MTKQLVKLNWLARALEIQAYHISCLKSDPNWTIEKTAKSLSRSLGSVSQDLLIASWLRSHEKQLRRCSSAREALQFIRSKRKAIQLGEI